MEENKINLTKNDEASEENAQQAVHVESVTPQSVQPQDSSSDGSPVVPTEESAANKNKKIGGIAIAVVAALVIIGGGSAVASGSYKKPVKTYYSAIESKSGKKLQKAIGKDMVAFLEDSFLSSDEDIDDEMDDMAESLYDNLEDEYGKKVKIKYKITDKEKVSKKEIKEFNNNMKDISDKKLKVSKGYELELDVTYKGKDDKDTEEETLTVLKINGDWVVSPENIIGY